MDSGRSRKRRRPLTCNDVLRDTLGFLQLSFLFKLIGTSRCFYRTFERRLLDAPERRGENRRVFKVAISHNRFCLQKRERGEGSTYEPFSNIPLPPDEVEEISRVEFSFTGIAAKKLAREYQTAMFVNWLVRHQCKNNGKDLCPRLNIIHSSQMNRWPDLADAVFRLIVRFPRFHSVLLNVYDTEIVGILLRMLMLAPVRATLNLQLVLTLPKKSIDTEGALVEAIVQWLVADTVAEGLQNVYPGTSNFERTNENQQQLTLTLPPLNGPNPPVNFNNDDENNNANQNRGRPLSLEYHPLPTNHRRVMRIHSSARLYRGFVDALRDRLATQFNDDVKRRPYLLVIEGGVNRRTLTVPDFNVRSDAERSEELQVGISQVSRDCVYFERRSSVVGPEPRQSIGSILKEAFEDGPSSPTGTQSVTFRLGDDYN